VLTVPDGHQGEELSWSLVMLLVPAHRCRPRMEHDRNRPASRAAGLWIPAENRSAAGHEDGTLITESHRIARPLRRQPAPNAESARKMNSYPRQYACAQIVQFGVRRLPSQNASDGLATHSLRPA
jgi:hypothetical protein